MKRVHKLHLVCIAGTGEAERGFWDGDTASAIFSRHPGLVAVRELRQKQERF